MERVCFLARVRSDRLEEYRARHQEVWPEMTDALRSAGWTNYTLFLADDGLLVGYLAGYAAVNFASKKITNSAGQSFTAGKLGKFSVGADSTVLLGPPFVFTKANISQFNF